MELFPHYNHCYIQSNNIKKSNHKELSSKKNLHDVFVQNIVIILLLEQKVLVQEVVLVMYINNDNYFVDKHKDEYFVDQPIIKRY
jgi:hypothetical protein